MRLSYLHEFLMEFEALDKRVQRQLRKKLDEMHRMRLEQFGHQVLQGRQFEGLNKLRASDWRLVYRIVDDACVFVTLGHRSDVYR